MQNVPFVDRDEAIELFKLLLAGEGQEPFQLRPILTFIAPPGGGKSTLIEHLLSTHCHPKGEHSTLPYAYVDFTHAETPKDVLSILVELRNQLARYHGKHDRPLAFPRFDLGVVSATARSSHDASRSLNSQETQKKIEEFISVFNRFGGLGESVGNVSLDPIFGYIPFIAYALRQAETIPVLQQKVQQLVNGATWDWYRKYLQLADETNVKQLLQCLLDINPSMRLDRKQLIEHLLPAALLEDLRSGLDDGACAVLFFDGFEALPHERCIVLLEALTVQSYRNQETAHQLLQVVIGSQQHLLDPVHSGQKGDTGMTRLGQDKDVLTAQRMYARWQAQFLTWDTLEHLSWEHLYLEFWLHDFTIDDIKAYVAKSNEQRRTKLLLDPSMARAMHRITYGHPWFLSTIVKETYARGLLLTADEFERLIDNHQFIDRLLAPLSEQEQVDLTLCAVPRILDVGSLQVVLDIKREFEAQRRLNRYRRHAIFQTASSPQRLVLHPVIRMLLLRQFSRYDEESDYYRTHLLMRQYFQKRAAAGNKEAQVEEAYHALALGDPELAIKLATAAQANDPAQWQQLLQAVEEAPTARISAETELRARTLVQGAREKDETIDAIVLNTWQLAGLKQDQAGRVAILHRLGKAYYNLARHSGEEQERQAYLTQALDYHRETLQVYNEQMHPQEWAAAQYELGRTFADFSGEDTHLQQARRAVRSALQVYTRRDNPHEWLAADQLLDEIDDKMDTARRLARGQEDPLLLAQPVQISGLPTQPVPPTSHSQPLLSLPGRSSAPKQKWSKRRKISAIASIAAIICVIIASVVLLLPRPTPASLPTQLCTATHLDTTPTLAPTPPSFADNKGIGTFQTLATQTLPAETIGISEGAYAFDTLNNRPGGDSMLQAADDYKNGDIADAELRWDDAIRKDSSNAEAAIYREDAKIAEKPYITFIVAGAMNGGGIANSRDVLQGALTAQLENNEASAANAFKLPNGVQIRLLIASSGSDRFCAAVVAQQIANAAKLDHTIVGVMGWSNSPREVQAMPIFNRAHLVTLSQSAASSDLSNSYPYFFRIIPINHDQAVIGANYAWQYMHVKRIVAFEDPGDSYSHNIEPPFEDTFKADGGTIAKTETYVADVTRSRTKGFTDVLDDALKYNPDLLYFAGNSADISAFLSALQSISNTTGKYANLKVMTGDSGSGVVEVPSAGTTGGKIHPGYNRLIYTGYAFPDEWGIEKIPVEPRFYQEYRDQFGAKGTKHGYGFDRTDAYAMLSYDATMTLLSGSQIALSQAPGTQPLTSDALKSGLEQITIARPLQGITGQIAFDPRTHEPVNKAMVIVQVNQDGTASVVPDVGIQGCYQLNECNTGLFTTS